MQKYAVLSHSDKSFTFEQEDKQRIDELRKFGQKLYSDHQIFVQNLSLADAKSKPKDFDTIAAILHIKTGEKKSTIKVMDHSHW